MIVPGGMRVSGAPWLLGLFVLVILVIARCDDPSAAGEGDAVTAGDVLEQAELRHYALVDHDHTMEVHLQTGDSQVRVVSILEWPRERVAEAEAEAQSYAIRIELLDDLGAVLWSGVSWQAARKSRYLLANGQAVEPATYASGGDTLLDPRLLLIPVLDLAADATRMRIGLAAPSGGRAVVQAYRLEEDESGDPVEAWFRLEQEDREQLATSNLFDPAAIDESELARLMEYRWSRLAPAGIPGQHFQPVEIYRARRELLPDTLPPGLEEEELLQLMPGRSLAFNALGPGLLTARLSSAEAGRIAFVQADCYALEEQRIERVAAPHDVVRELTIPIGPGAHSLVLQSRESVCDVRVSFHRDADDTIGVPVPAATTAGTWYILGRHGPLHVETEPPPERNSLSWALPAAGVDEEVYRLEVRLANDPQVVDPPDDLIVQLRDRDGVVLEATPLRPDPTGDSACWLGGEARIDIGLPLQCIIRPPAGSRSLHLTGSRACFARLLVRPHGIPFTPIGSLPDPALADQRVQPWHLVRSQEHAAILANGQLTLLHADAAWVGPDDRPPPEQRFTTGLVPVQAAASRQLAWPQRPFSFDRNREWTRLHCSRLADADPRALLLERLDARLPHGLWVLPGDDGVVPPPLADDLTLGRALDRLLLGSDLPALPPTVLVNLPPQEVREAPTWHIGSAVRCDVGDDCAFMLDHETGAGSWLTINAAGEAQAQIGSDGGSFACWIEALAPADSRRWFDPQGSWSFRHRAYLLPPSSEQLPVDWRSGAGDLRTRRFSSHAAYAMPLGDDLASGRYLLRIRNTGDRPLWLSPSLSSDQLLQDLHPYDQAVWNLRQAKRMTLRIRRSRRTHPLSDDPRLPQVRWCDHDGERAVPTRFVRSRDGWWEAEIVTPGGFGTLALLHPGPERSAPWQYLLQHPDQGNPQAARARLYTAPAERGQPLVLPASWQRESFLPLGDDGLDFPVDQGETLRLTACSITHPLIDLPRERRWLQLLWLDRDGQTIAQADTPCEATAIANGDAGSHWLHWESAELTVPPQAASLRVRSSDDDLRGLRCATPWRDTPTVQVLPDSRLRVAKVRYRDPYLVDGWSQRFPSGIGVRELARDVVVTQRTNRIFAPLRDSDWDEVLQRVGTPLAVREHIGELHFRERGDDLVGDDRPWTPYTYARVPVGIPVPIDVRADPLADPGAAIPLRLHYELPERFPPGRNLLVQLNDDIVHHWQPVSAIGNLDLPLTRPGGQLLRVECAIAGTEAYINAVPLGSGEEPRWRLRRAILVPPGTPCTIDLRGDPEARRLRLSLPIYLPTDLPPERSLELRARLHRSDGQVVGEQVILVLPDPDRRAAVHTSDDGRWFYAGRIALSPDPGLHGHIQLERPSDLPLLIRPFQTLAWDEQRTADER